MTPAQRRAVRDVLAPRVTAVQDAGGAGWLLVAARTFLEDHTLSDAWWGAVTLLLRAERVTGVRPRVDRVNAEARALLQELRAAVGGAANDPDFQEPVAR